MVRDPRSLAARFRFLKGSAFHPQWFAHRMEREAFSYVGRHAAGRVIDVGCSDQRIRAYLTDSSYYLGLDYYTTATQWYDTRPTVFGDAHALPIAASAFDSALLLDVMEHLENPAKCLAEIGRILRPGGKLLLKVPFMYPIHDAPRDFGRWTEYGLDRLARDNGFTALEIRRFGKPVETAALIANISRARTVMRWLASGNPLALLGLLLPFAILLANLLAAIGAASSDDDPMMPHSYVVVLEKARLPVDQSEENSSDG